MSVGVRKIVNMRFKILLLAAFLASCQTLALDRGSFGNFERSLNNKAYGYQVVDDPTSLAATPKVERFEVRAGDCASDAVWSDCKNDRERSELTQAGSSELPGSSAWYSWNIYFPEDYATLSPSKTALGQFHQRGSHPVWMFQEASGGYYLDEQITGQSNNNYQLIASDQLRGKWHNIVVNVSWSNQPRWSDKQNGFFKVWVNGEQKVDYVGPTMTAKEIYFKYGIYRSFISRYKSTYNNPVPTQTVFFSNVRRASTRDGLSPK